MYLGLYSLISESSRNTSINITCATKLALIWHSLKPRYTIARHTPPGYSQMTLESVQRMHPLAVRPSLIPFQRLTRQPPLARSAQYAALIATALITLSACGGGSSGDSTPANTQNPLIIGGTAGGDASALSDDELRRTAANRASAGLGVNLNNLSRLSNDAMTDQTDGDLMGGIANSSDMQSIDSLDTSNNNFLINSLGIDDTGARVTREGNVITIDPDDESMCGDDLPLAGDLNNDPSQCQQLASDLTVMVDAQSAESGVITYLFQDAPVLLIGYSPMGASYEIKLAGLQNVLLRSQELSGITSTDMTNYSGALRLSGTILNDEPGQEAGELSLNVTETINIGSSESPTGLLLQPSTVFKVTLDEASGDVSMGVDWGALQLVAESGSASSEGDFSTSTTQLNLGGLSAELSFNEDQPALKVTNIGIGDVPLTVTIDSLESVNLTLARFGITIDNDTGTINLDGPLNASFMLDNIAQILEDQASDFTASAMISAPANTVLVPQENGSTLVSSGGPLSATVIGGDGTSSGQADVSIGAGECFGSGDDSQNANFASTAIATVPCN